MFSRKLYFQSKSYTWLPSHRTGVRACHNCPALYFLVSEFVVLGSERFHHGIKEADVCILRDTELVLHIRSVGYSFFDLNVVLTPEKGSDVEIQTIVV